ncbi:MAG: hypothetical protein FD153_178 [Rhodospirillaceae bacterium]|nr:MAG: hypothetical protein FD153_178 [Rhodospirillaceae bacterium]
MLAEGVLICKLWTGDAPSYPDRENSPPPTAGNGTLQARPPEQGGVPLGAPQDTATLTRLTVVLRTIFMKSWAAIITTGQSVTLKSISAEAAPVRFQSLNSARQAR